MSELDELRSRILEIDDAMLKLWSERDQAARRAGQIKLGRGEPLQNFEVEKSVLEHALASAKKYGVSADRVRTFVRLLLESSHLMQEKDRVRAAGNQGRRALVLGGAGLMGSWFAKFLEETGYTVFVKDLKESPFPRPGRSDVFDLVVVATPPSTVPDVLQDAATHAKPSGLIVDVASVKAPAVAPLRALASKGRRVASLHPMFGPSVDVLMGRNVLALDVGSRDATQEARSLFAVTAAQTRELPIEAHDPLMAEILGLSHATSIAFSEALASGPFPLADLEPVASTTFRKQVDVSREVAKENPRLYYEIQTLNPESLAMLKRLEAAVARLRSIVEKKDRLGFVDLMHRADAYYQGVNLRSK